MEKIPTAKTDRRFVRQAKPAPTCGITIPAIEPTERLDSDAGRMVLDLLERLRSARNLTIVLVTHDATVAERADRVVEMLDGRLAPAAEPATASA